MAVISSNVKSFRIIFIYYLVWSNSVRQRKGSLNYLDNKIMHRKNLILCANSGENHMVLPTVTRAYSFLSVTIKSDTVADRISDDSEVAPAFDLNFGFRGYERSSVFKSGFHIGFQVFHLQIYQHTSI